MNERSVNQTSAAAVQALSIRLDRPATAPWINRIDQGAVIGFWVVVLSLTLLSTMTGRGWVHRDDVIPRSSVKAIELNGASIQQLNSLPGIGPVLAERIVRDREVRGPFRSVEELDRVAGIGPKTLQRIAPWIRAEQDNGARR